MECTNGLERVQLVWGQHSVWLGIVLHDEVYALSQWPIYGAVYSMIRIHGPGNQGREVGMTSLTINELIAVNSLQSCASSAHIPRLC